MLNETVARSVVLAVLVLVPLGGCRGAAVQREPVAEVRGHQVLTVAQMREDLEYTIRTLRDVHPSTYHGFSREQEGLIETLRGQIREPMKAQEFYLLAGRLLCSMKDGHTKLEPMKGSQNRSVNIPLAWVADGLYVTTDCAPFRAGDRVVAIGGRSSEELIAELRPFISAENLYWLRYKAADALTREVYLAALGVMREDHVDWTVQRAGEKQVVSTGFMTGKMYYGRHPARHWVGHTIDKDASLGVFHLDQCLWNDEYRKAVHEFFAAVSRDRIEHAVVDLRWNPGGNSNVMGEFLRYLDVDRYKHLGMEVRYSKASRQQRNDPWGWGRYVGKSKTKKNDRCRERDLLFHGRLYVLVSVETFSSANDFALIVKDNKLGTIVGEPTGNRPTCYGDCLSFQMPNTGFRFTVSYKRFVRPEPANDPEDALQPDVLVPTTIEDVLQHRDPQIDAVRAIVKSRKVSWYHAPVRASLIFWGLLCG
jgi:C-terminal processing protease CtpA/Prc